MDAVELQLPAAIVTKVMRSSGCSGGGGVTRVELLGSQSERETCTSSFHPEKDVNCNNANGSRESRPNFWNKMSDEDLYRSAGQLSSLRSEEAFVDHDMASVPEAKQSQRKSGKSSRTNGSSSRRSRTAHMEAGLVDPNDLPKELGSYPGKCNLSEKSQSAKQKTSVSGKRSDKRNGKVPKNKCDSFSVKAGLSSFSSSAGGNNILGVYGSKHDICDFAKHVDEPSLNELLDGSYKCPNSIKDKEKKMETLNGSILSSVREACSILQLQKPNQTPNVAPPLDATYNPNASSSCLLNNDENKGDAADPSCNKVEKSCSGLNDDTNILQFPLFPPKDVLERLSLLPPKDLDLMLLDSMKPTSTSKVQNGGSLPTFPWSHISGGHFKANPDTVKSTPSKTTCQGRWARMKNKKTTTLGDTTSYLTDFETLTYNQNLVPISSPTETPKPPTITPKPQGGDSAGVLAAAQTLCDIAARFRVKKSIRPTKFTSDEKLEKALFAVPGSRPTDDTRKKLRVSIHEKPNPYHWPTTTTTTAPQSSRSSPFKNSSMEAKHHESKRPIASPPARLSNKPPKLRKLVPMEWKSGSRGDQKGNGKY